MLEKFKNSQPALLGFGLALLLGYSITVDVTKSAEIAVQRMIVIVVIWALCALVWLAVHRLPQPFIDTKRPPDEQVSERKRGFGGHAQNRARRGQAYSRTPES